MSIQNYFLSDTKASFRATIETLALEIWKDTHFFCKSILFRFSSYTNFMNMVCFLSVFYFLFAPILRSQQIYFVDQNSSGGQQNGKT